MDDSLDFLYDNDPDHNYYDAIIDENNLFTNFTSVSEYLNSCIDKDKNFLTIFCQNIRSLNSNLDDFISLFPSNNMPDVFIFSETWYNVNTVISITGYSSFHTVRDGRSGGVSIFFKSYLNVIHMPELSLSNTNIEICSVKLSTNSETIYISGIYRPISGTIDDFCLQMESIVNSTIFSRNRCIFGGDFNINLFSESDHVNRFIDMMRSIITFKPSLA